MLKDLLKFYTIEITQLMYFLLSLLLQSSKNIFRAKKHYTNIETLVMCRFSLTQKLSFAVSISSEWVMHLLWLSNRWLLDFGTTPLMFKTSPIKNACLGNIPSPYYISENLVGMNY